jgi:hypothetical protein
MKSKRSFWEMQKFKLKQKNPLALLYFDQFRMPSEQEPYPNSASQFEMLQILALKINDILWCVKRALFFWLVEDISVGLSFFPSAP